MNCKECKFWKCLGKKGECRKRSPLVENYTDPHGLPTVEWPPTYPDDWCGDFEEIQLGDK